MKNQKPDRLLGLAFLLQFVTSFTSGVFLKPIWFVEGSMGETMLNIAANTGVLHAQHLLDALTAIGVVFLGAILYAVLRNQDERIALTAFGFYILEAALLAASILDGYSLLSYSREFAAAGQPADLLVMGKAAYDSMTFVGGTMHMLVFCAGAILFYTLLDRSRAVPRWMSLWGLITLFPMLAGTLTQFFGYTIPIYFYIPYVPFELVIGLWILVRGVSVSQNQRAG